MHSSWPSHSLPLDLLDRILERFGLGAPPDRTVGGLRQLYAAWCLAVPFDNVRKMIALRVASHHPLPGGDPREFFESWLSDGCGGTCWPTSNALFALVSSLG